MSVCVFLAVHYSYCNYAQMYDDIFAFNACVNNFLKIENKNF